MKIKLLSLCISFLAAAVLTTFSVVFAAAGEFQPVVDYQAPDVIFESSQCVVPCGNALTESDSSLPYYRSSYSSVTQGKVTSAKNQSPYGLCWDFAATAACESSLIGKGTFTAENTDLSELQLVNFMYGNKVDPLGYCSSDSTGRAAGTILTGGNSFVAMWAMAGWDNGAPESVLPFCEPYLTQVQNRTVSDVLARKYDVAHLQNIRIIPTGSDSQSRMNLKKAITEYGALSVSYFYDSSNPLSDGYYYYCDSEGSNHAVALVGWNDSVSKNLFSYKDKNGVTHQPEGNGAWLIKNSWGTDWGTDGDEYSADSGAEGYFWLSYYDVSFNSSEGAYVFSMEPAETYQYNYQYDGTAVAADVQYSNKTSVAATYAVKGLTSDREKIKAVGIGIFSPDVEYSVQIYRNPDPSYPTKGEALLSKPVTGRTDYSGYYTVTIPADEMPVLKKGEYFSVVITLSSVSGDSFRLYFECDSQSSVANSADDLTWCCVPGGNFVRLTKKTLRIKAYTVDKKVYTWNTSVKIDSVTNQSGSVKISWNAVNGANGYKLYRSANGKSWTEIATFSGSDNFSYTDSSANVNGTEYSYKLSAFKEEGDATYITSQSEAKTVCRLDAPAVSSVTNTNSGIKVSWNKNSRATGYIIYRSAADGTYTKISAISGNTKVTYTDTKANVNGSKYTYRIAAVKKTGTGTYVSAKGTAKTVYRLFSPSVSSTVNSVTGITVKWSKNSKATGYRVYRSCNGGSYKLITTVSGNTRTYYTDTGAKTDGAKYAYKITAVKKVGSAKYFSAESTAKALFRLNRPTVSGLTSASKGFTVKWNRNTKATGYEVQYSTKSDFSSAVKKTVNSSSKVSYKASGLRLKTKYYVRVRSYRTVNGIRYYSSWSSSKTVKTK